MSTEPVGPRRLRDPVAFAAEIREALRYEAGLMVKAAGVLAVLAAILVLRAVYLSLPATTTAGGQQSEKGERWRGGECRYASGQPWRPCSRSCSP